MGVMTVGTEKVGPLAGAYKVSGPLPMDARLPVPINVAVAFPAEPVAFRKVDKLSIEEPQFISIFSIVTVEAPPHRLCVMELDIGMLFLELSLLRDDFHRGVAVTAGKHPLCHRERGNGKLFTNPSRRRRKTNP
jgi:hypothetical protein